MPADAIVCPFCGLLCDDLRRGEGGAVDTRGCPKAAAGFAREAIHREHRVGGRAVALADAAGAAAAVLRQARLPLVTGLATDMSGLRAALRVADRLGAVIDRWGAAAQAGNLAVTQREGALTATFAEVANRADVIVLVGSDPARAQPRFFERLVRNPAPLYRAGAPWVAHVGAAADAPRDPLVAERIVVEPARLLDALSTLALALVGRPPRAEALPAAAALTALAERLGAAQYGVLVWEPAALGERVDLVVGLLLQILRELNRRTRCVGLPLGGDDNAQGAVLALLWQTGWPLRVSLADGAPEHDPWRFEAERMVAAGETDALLWVSSAASPPPATAIPTVALVAGDVALAAEPEVTIRVGLPGVDHAGAMVRADTVIALPLAPVRAGPLPSVADALGTIAARLEEAS